MSEVGAFHACKQKISDPLFNGWKSTVNSLSLQPSLHYTIFNHLAFCLLFIYTLSNMNSFWIDITVFQQFFRLFSFSLFQLLLRGCFNKMYLTEPPLHIVITFSHHFMFAYSFLARIIRVFPFISVFFFHQPAFYDIWYVCAWMLICTYINQVRAFNAFFTVLSIVPAGTRNSEVKKNLQWALAGMKSVSFRYWGNFTAQWRRW